uniref:Uncharacterized protein n=1 Tax=Toxoplasma gondii COUG TaxID=1074873 RepID=A0A2G8XZT6_TOXGO|nr:hypothetical protein TGCOUG_312650A [Toxoplasma gondii COUG]
MAGALSPVDQLQLPSCTEQDFQEALAAIKTTDAIMDEGIFEQLKRYSAYKYLCHKRQQVQSLQRALSGAASSPCAEGPSAAGESNGVGTPQPSGDRGQRGQCLSGVRAEGTQARHTPQRPSVVLDISTPEDVGCIRKINHEACNLLANSYEGYAWMCQVAAELAETLEVSAHPKPGHGTQAKGASASGALSTLSSSLFSGEGKGDWPENDEASHTASQSAGDGAGVSVLLHALCDFLTMKYDSTVTRKNLLDDRSTHGSWNPPAFYWQLFKHPSIISCLLKLYQERPQDEFLACWFQDYTQHYRRVSSTRTGLFFSVLSAEEKKQSACEARLFLPDADPSSLSLLDEHLHTQQASLRQQTADKGRPQLSKLTSNFSVYTLRMSEEIRRFLLWDVD